MRTKIVFAISTAICSFVLAVISFAQETPLEITRRGPDPNNGMIEGRVLLPSGQSANFNIKVLLKKL